MFVARGVEVCLKHGSVCYLLAAGFLNYSAKGKG